MRFLSSLLIALVVNFGSSVALAQVPLPDPMDVIMDTENRPRGDCGNGFSNKPVVREVQAAYARAGRCAEYDSRLATKYILWIRQFDPNDKTYRGADDIGLFETVPYYFTYHQLNWWDGSYSDGYREPAKYAGQTAWATSSSRADLRGYDPTPWQPGNATTPPPPGNFGRSGVNSGSPKSPGSTTDAAPAQDGNVGACGLAVANDVQRQEQEIYAKYGTCDQFRASRGGR